MKIKSRADPFFDVFSGKTHIVPTISPGVIPKVEIQEGEWESPLGSMKRWEYMIDGKLEFGIEKVVAYDEANRSISLNVVEGHILEKYDYFLVTMLVTPLPEEGVEGSLVEWTIDYVKKHDQAPHAQVHLNVAEQMTKDIDDHLTPVPVTMPI